MTPDHRQQIDQLGRQIEALRRDLTQLGDTDDLGNMLKIIHRPGWTTLAEIAFAHAIAESLAAQVKATAQLKQAFVNASQSVAG